MSRISIVTSLSILLISLMPSHAQDNARLEKVDHDIYNIVRRFDVDEVETSFPVKFCQAFAEDNHYIAYYDKDKNLCVGYRKLTEDSFHKTVLDSKIGWDSHNYLVMTVDNDGYIHLSGNMHNVQLKYWRSVRPYDASEFIFFDTMVGSDETSVTYPSFLLMEDGRLLFHYREGGSGHGYEVYNLWQPETLTWTRFIDEPLIDGEEKRSAYMQEPVYANGYYHLYWVWRSSPDCSTNHDLSYARSRDLIHWESVLGEPVESPIVYSETALKVDAPEQKQGNGMLNGVQRLTFDSRGNVIVCNMKYDENGYSQFYAYKMGDDGKWRESCLTDWTYRFDFSGFGSINFVINMGRCRNLGDGRIALGFIHPEYGKGDIVFDEDTLDRIGYYEPTPDYPEELDELTTLTGQYSRPAAPQLTVDGRFILRRETLVQNNDLEPSAPLPPPMQLEMIEFEPKKAAL